MGYQGRNPYDSGRNWDRGNERYRAQRDWRDDQAYRYGTRGQFGGAGYRGRPSDYDPDERGFFDRAGDEIRSWFGDEEAERRREYDDYYNRPYGDPRDQSSRIGYASASRSSEYLPNRGHAPFAGERSGFGNEDNGYRSRAFGPQRDFGGHHDSNYHAWRQQRIDELDRDYYEYQTENRSR
ncbi:MAG: SWFGD domain-containing protein, partial [Sphingobium sp.]